MAQDNQSYWNSRKRQLDASLAKDEKRLFAKLAMYYEREAAVLDKQIAAYYAQYGEDNVIAYRQLLQTLDDADVQLLMQDMNAFATKYPEYADLLPVRESIYKLNRLEGLQTSVLLQQLEIGAAEQEQLTAFFLKQAARYANFSAALLGFGEQFYRIDSDMVRNAVGNRWCEGKNFSERIWGNRQKLAHTLQTEIVNGFIRGEDYHTLSRQLRQKFVNVSKKQAERLVYTEDTYLSCEAAITPFAKDPSFTQYRFTCTHDGNACDICRALDGTAFPIKERTPGTNFPPMHPWCRCFFEIVVPDLETLRKNEREKTLTSGEKSSTIKEKAGTVGNSLYRIGKLDIQKYRCITDDIRTDEVIITDRQIMHIKERHPNDYERFGSYLKEIINKPDYIIEANKPYTALILKEILVEQEKFKTVLRLVTSNDNPEYCNSIITFMKIDDKEWNRLLKNKKVLYKSE